MLCIFGGAKYSVFTPSTSEMFTKFLTFALFVLFIVLLSKCDAEGPLLPPNPGNSNLTVFPSHFSSGGITRSWSPCYYELDDAHAILEKKLLPKNVTAPSMSGVDFVAYTSTWKYQSFSQDAQDKLVSEILGKKTWRIFRRISFK